MLQYTEFRLAGGRLYDGFNEGRLEVRLAGSNIWGVICGDDWDFRAAMVTCKHLGVGYARTHQKVHRFFILHYRYVLIMLAGWLPFCNVLFCLVSELAYKI